ncbi:hypothetical protein HYALB_00008173 [Hymenoscyphus albidus]|uniref:Uncharacterized protein n=1 Tax=Hymenoscyphus albidus TaxID=595503 RepID=A0A9N9M6T4_9HELO|nr:hypothetical protein HYALB_00008173 [Hymenoscyphus albidus]
MIRFTVFKGSPSGDIIQDETTTPAVKANEVLLKHTHSGVCGTDLHYLHTSMVLGHEGVGIVQALGESVTSFERKKSGDRLGFGYTKDGCGTCKQCLKGYTFQCESSPRYFAGTDLDQGSFAEYSMWPSTRLVKLPNEIESADAGPFMCACQTVFVPMLRNGFKKDDRVGIIGIGGLGHLAIQFANAFGCEVVVFSSSDNKKEEAMRFGAKEFWNTKNLKAEDVKKLHHLVATTSAQPNWELYADLMAPFGHIYPLTIADGNLSFPYLPLVLKELSIHGSCSSSIE